MAIFFENTDRNVIPNWRGFEKTVHLGELKSFRSAKSSAFRMFKKSDLNEVLEAWKDHKTISYAGDLISCAYVSNFTELIEVKEALNFVIDNKDYAPSALFKLSWKLKYDNGNNRES